MFATSTNGTRDTDALDHVPATAPRRTWRVTVGRPIRPPCGHVVSLCDLLRCIAPQCNNLPVGSSLTIKVSNTGSGGDGSCHFSSSCGSTPGLPSWAVSPGNSAQSGTVAITSACNFGYTLKNEDIIHSNHCLVEMQFMLPTPSPSVTPTYSPSASLTSTGSPSHVPSSGSPSQSRSRIPTSDQNAGGAVAQCHWDGSSQLSWGVFRCWTLPTFPLPHRQTLQVSKCTVPRLSARTAKHNAERPWPLFLDQCSQPSVCCTAWWAAVAHWSSAWVLCS